MPPCWVLGWPGMLPPCCAHLCSSGSVSGSSGIGDRTLDTPAAGRDCDHLVSACLQLITGMAEAFDAPPPDSAQLLEITLHYATRAGCNEATLGEQGAGSVLSRDAAEPSHGSGTPAPAQPSSRGVGMRQGKTCVGGLL